MPRPVFEAELLSKTQLSDDTLQLTFQLADDSFSFQAGQFVSIQFELDGDNLKRSYSIASAPGVFQSMRQIDIAIALLPDGRASRRFQEAVPGEHFGISGPFGLLVLPDSLPERLVLVGTGTGMAPYRAMLPELERIAASGIALHILMGSRHRKDVIYREEFSSLASRFEQVTFELCLSREANPDVGIQEYPGYVQTRFAHLNLSPERDLPFLCGNPAMIDDAVAWLSEAGFGPRQIKREKYTFSR
ncbi:ferredoxin--NADP reductase [Kistimonas asteriae]|uniref:ferredoxin--NADP reductase n=1 Tax=Kistimonas asteriae TaxID=517724 RepID=UPI001BA47A2F|nr:FAD-binding oxidoreductase [Kistimonas asteriae]